MFRNFFPVLALALPLAGCIEFEKQTLTYEHDVKSDTLLIHQTYHGIYGAEDVTQLSEKEREQLADVMKGQRTFFFANWIFELNVEGSKEELAGAVVPKTNSLEEAYRRAKTNLLAQLVANVRVENGKFYLNDKGQPCGTQRVTIRNVNKLVTAGNALLRRALEVEMKGKDTATERELINTALARSEPFFTLTGQQIRFRFPLSKAEYRKISYADGNLGRILLGFLRQGGEMSHERGELHLRFGHTDATRETVTLPIAGKESYRGKALTHIRDTNSLTKDFDPKRNMEDFLRTKPAEPNK